jgi:cell division protein FtsB
VDWLRLRKRAVEATFVNEYPTDARRPVDDFGGAEPDTDTEPGRRLRRRIAVFALYAFFIGGGVAALFGESGVVALLRLQGELRSARAELTEQRQVVETLRQEVARLRDDPMARERVAREQLGLARPGEMHFLLPSTEQRPGEGR